MALNERRKHEEIREEIGKVVQQIKNGNNPIGVEASASLKACKSFGKLIVASANAWIYREKVNHLLEQLRTGNLEGIEPIGTLDGRES